MANEILVRVKLKFGSLEDVVILNAAEQDVIIDDNLGWISLLTTNFHDTYLDLKICSNYMGKNEMTRYQINIIEMKSPISDWLTDRKGLSMISNFARPLTLHSKISEISRESTRIEVTRSLEGIKVRDAHSKC